MVRELAVLNLALVFLAACGGDDDGGVVCETFSACGGDPAGEWVFVDACVDEAEFSLGIEECPQATATFTEVTVSGTLTFDPDGTYELEQNVLGTLALTVPLSCFEGTLEDCDEVGDLVDLECSESGDSCACPQEIETEVSGTGTWEVDGADITIAPDGEEAETGQFCVDGDRLELRSPETDLGDMSTLFLERG